MVGVGVCAHMYVCDSVCVCVLVLRWYVSVYMSLRVCARVYSCAAYVCKCVFARVRMHMYL